MPNLQKNKPTSPRFRPLGLLLALLAAALATGRSLRQQHWAASTATAGGTKNTTSDHPADGGP